MGNAEIEIKDTVSAQRSEKNTGGEGHWGYVQLTDAGSQTCTAESDPPPEVGDSNPT